MPLANFLMSAAVAALLVSLVVLIHYEALRGISRCSAAFAGQTPTKNSGGDAGRVRRAYGGRVGICHRVLVDDRLLATRCVERWQPALDF
jgi:hypothetical protein